MSITEEQDEIIDRIKDRMMRVCQPNALYIIKK